MFGVRHDTKTCGYIQFIISYIFKIIISISVDTSVLYTMFVYVNIMCGVWYHWSIRNSVWLYVALKFKIENVFGVRGMLMLDTNTSPTHVHSIAFFFLNY